MLENLTFTDTRQIKAYADPVRLRMLNLLIDKPMTGAKLARLLDIPRQRVHYHLHILEENGLIVLEEERVHRGLLEKVYRATARSYHTPDSRLLEGGDDLVRDAGAEDSLIQSMMEQIAVDLAKRRPLPEGALPDHHLQGGTMLSEDQHRILARDLNALYRKFEEFEKQNLKQPPQKMIYSRLTLLLMQIRNPLESVSAEMDEGLDENFQNEDSAELEQE